MPRNVVRERLRAGQPTIGCFLGLGSPSVAELLACRGFDWLVIETEHNGLDAAQVEEMLRAISSGSAIPLVRVPSSDHVFIQRALDLGAMGVVVPMVRTAEEAAAVVRATRYPPEGTRSFGPLRASRYTLDNADYLASANENTLVVLILETKEAVQDLDQIAAVPGVDVLHLGPFDLCLALGLDPIQQPHPQVDEVLERALELGQRQGIAVGSGAATADEVKVLRRRGVTMIAFGPDYRMLSDAALVGLQAFGESA
jgi:4-hydroxy-2-oxoheptanedioate aldolase